MAREPKYLLRKASGSRRENFQNGDFSASRGKKVRTGEELPMNESFKHSYNAIDTTLVKRWLFSQVGEDFDDVYSRFLERLQPQYREEYRHCIFWYVEPAKNVTVSGMGLVYGHGNNAYMGSPQMNLLPNSQQSRFYVAPRDNKLYAISDEQLQESKRIWKEKANASYIEAGLEPRYK